PTDPGAGYLRVGAGAPIRFQAALVSGPLRPDTAPRPPAMVRVFGTRVVGPVSRPVEAAHPSGRSISAAVLDRLA
ncbi:hypothetical protein, partial [Mycobacterium avium]